jgi:hypothetical protein|tara:strand:- start:830 stop:1294 length:465 start_codon:yes stop_codon:yes gene_type:complete
MELPKITPVIQFATAAFALAVGGYSAGEKFGWFKNEILVWSPEHFRIESAKIGHPVTVTVARIKKRDDCSVENFEVTVRDGAGVIHQATPSMTRFTGPAGPDIDTFTYLLTISDKEATAPGKATLLATIKYKCPEGERTVTYPRHQNLTFMLER